MVRALKILLLLASVHEIKALRPEASVEEYRGSSLATAQLKDSLTSLVEAHKSGRQEEVTRLLREISSPDFNNEMKKALEALRDATEDYINKTAEQEFIDLQGRITTAVVEVEVSVENITDLMGAAASADDKYYTDMLAAEAASGQVASALSSFNAAMAIVAADGGNCSTRQDLRDVICPKSDHPSCSIQSPWDANPYKVECDVDQEDEVGKCTGDYISQVTSALDSIKSAYESALTTRRTEWTPYDTQCKADLDDLTAKESALESKVAAWNTANQVPDQTGRDGAICKLGWEIGKYCEAKSSYDSEKQAVENQVSELEEDYELPAMVLCLCNKLIEGIDTAGSEQPFSGLTSAIIEECEADSDYDFGSDIGEIDWSTLDNRVETVQTNIGNALNRTEESGSPFTCGNSDQFLYFDEERKEILVNGALETIQYCDFDAVPARCAMISDVGYPVGYETPEGGAQYQPPSSYETKNFTPTFIWAAGPTAPAPFGTEVQC